METQIFFFIFFLFFFRGGGRAGNAPARIRAWNVQYNIRDVLENKDSIVNRDEKSPV